MIRSGEEILVDIDVTLNQLIQNAETITRISFDALFENEVEALQKTQESLLSRLIHMNDLLDSDQKQQFLRKKPSSWTAIEEKVIELGKRNAQMIHLVKKDIQSTRKNAGNKPHVRKNRKKTVKTAS